MKVDGKDVTPTTRHTYLLYHKPKGVMCSRRDDRGRPLIYDELDVPATVQSVGRLDMDSEGLLLLTDDGSLAQALTRPQAHLARQYRVRVAGHLSLESLQALREGGVDIGRDELSDPWEITVDSESGGHTWLTVVIHRGRWREVRRTIEAQGHPVRRLIRTQFGPLKLADLPPRATREIKPGELRQLKRFSETEASEKKK